VNKCREHIEVSSVDDRLKGGRSRKNEELVGLKTNGEGSTGSVVVDVRTVKKSAFVKFHKIFPVELALRHECSFIAFLHFNDHHSWMIETNKPEATNDVWDAMGIDEVRSENKTLIELVNTHGKIE